MRFGLNAIDALQHGIQDRFHLQPGQMLAKAEVKTMPPAQMVERIALNIERVRIGIFALIAIGSAVLEPNIRASR